MTTEQYQLMVQYASELRSALNAYEEKYGIIDLKADRISEIIDAGANLIHLVDSLEPLHSPHDEDPF